MCSFFEAEIVIVQAEKRQHVLVRFQAAQAGIRQEAAAAGSAAGSAVPFRNKGTEKLLPMTAMFARPDAGLARCDFTWTTTFSLPDTCYTTFDIAGLTQARPRTIEKHTCGETGNGEIRELHDDQAPLYVHLDEPPGDAEDKARHEPPSPLCLLFSVSRAPKLYGQRIISQPCHDQVNFAYPAIWTT